MAQLSHDPGRQARAAGRRCGTCSVCCSVLRVDELAKPAGRDCAHQRIEGGCAIHATRPPICRGYHCLWLQGGLEDEERPDRTGGVVDLESTGLGVRITIHEVRAGAFEDSAALRAIAGRYREDVPVRVVEAGAVEDPDRPFRVLLAGGVEQRVIGERVEIHRDGVRVGSRRMPWAERAARRIAIWWRRRGLVSPGGRDR